MFVDWVKPSSIHTYDNQTNHASLKVMLERNLGVAHSLKIYFAVAEENDTVYLFSLGIKTQ